MRRIEGVEIKKSSTASEPLPAGAYVAKIINAEIKEYTWGEVLVVYFDIAEGEYKWHFSNQYKTNTNEDKKWKGTFRITVPQEGNQWYDKQRRSFGNAVACIEESNPGYHWDWDEKTLQEKLIGVMFRNFEWEIDGNIGWSTECCAFVSVEDIRSGNFRQMKDRPLKNKANNTRQSTPKFEPVDDLDDLPFN